tara:strand:- start:40 stop:372 length:333 start_codon:yes stop_codon:yes gene_type:complete
MICLENPVNFRSLNIHKESSIYDKLEKIAKEMWLFSGAEYDCFIETVEFNKTSNCYSVIVACKTAFFNNIKFLFYPETKTILYVGERNDGMNYSIDSSLLEECAELILNV